MANNPIKLLEMNQQEYNKLINELEDAVDNAIDLDLESLDSLEGELNSLEKMMYSIKKITQDISKKIVFYKHKKDKKYNAALKDKNSLEYNEVMLFQGKTSAHIEKLKILASSGNLDAQFLLGKTFLNGIIGTYGELKMKDTKLGLEWLSNAYKKGHIEAGYLIAVHEKSIFNTKKAIDIFEDLAKNNCIKALNELIIIYEKDPNYNNFENMIRIKNKLLIFESNLNKK